MYCIFMIIICTLLVQFLILSKVYRILDHLFIRIEKKTCMCILRIDQICEIYKYVSYIKCLYVNFIKK